MKSIVIVLLAILCGCGGGSVANEQPAAPPPTVTPPPLPQHYQATDLPPISGSNAAQANGVNSAGHAVGYSVLNSVPYGTLWKDGTVIDLGPNTLADAINDSDQIVGYRKDPQGLTHAYLWPDMADLGSIAGYDSSIATGINNSGTVVGVAYNLAAAARHLAVPFNPRLFGVAHPFVWSQPTGIIMLSGAVTVSGINQKGQISGAAVVGEEIHGVLLTGD